MAGCDRNVRICRAGIVRSVPILSSIWQSLAATGAILSLVLITLYWHPWYPAGSILDILILAHLFQIPG